MNVYHMNPAILARALQLLKAWVKIMKLPVAKTKQSIYVCQTALHNTIKETGLQI